MPVALLIARNSHVADGNAFVDWKWWPSNELRHEYRRPDTNEIVRFLPDLPGTTNGLAWGTTVYLGSDANMRNDWPHVSAAISAGQFVQGDPQLPPPRLRKKKEVRQ